MAVNNSTILAKAWLVQTDDFQQRVPNPTIAGIDATMEALFDPMNGVYLNAFIDTLINRVGMTLVRQQEYTNPLAVFKGAKMPYGSTIQEIAPRWIKAHSYDDTSGAELLKLERPEAAAWYHSQNRRDKYPISIEYDELRSAFAAEQGLNNLISAIMATPQNSDQLDEYRIMVELIGYYDKHWGFYKHGLAQAPTNEATGKEFLTALRTYAGRLAFPSALYNAGAVDIPVFAKKSELVLLITPEVQASIDVNTLSAVFNLGKAEIEYRTVIIDQFPVPDMVALLTTEDFFVCHDTVYRTGSFFNEDDLATKYYLHHWGVYSVSPFVPAIAFVVGQGTTTPTIIQNVTGFSLSAGWENATDVTYGAVLPINAELTGTIDDPANANVNDAIQVRPDAWRVASISIVNEGNIVSELNPIYTYVDSYGRLHIQDKLYGTLYETSSLHIVGVSSYLNPSGVTETYTAELNVALSGTTPRPATANSKTREQKKSKVEEAKAKAEEKKVDTGQSEE